MDAVDPEMMQPQFLEPHAINGIGRTTSPQTTKLEIIISRDM